MPGAGVGSRDDAPIHALPELRGRAAGLFYVEHLVFALHLHAFVFAAQLAGLVAPIHGFVLGAANGAHLFVGLRRVFRESWPRTLGKGVLLAVVYGLALTGAMLAAAVLTVLVAD